MTGGSMELKAVCEELDELAVNYFQILEELSEQRRRFEKFVREGHLNLSKARFSMGNKAVGSLQYDSTSMCALAHIETRDEGDHHAFELSRTKALKRSERKSAAGSESDENQQRTDTVVRRRVPGSSDSQPSVETLTADLEELKTSEQQEQEKKKETQGVATDPLLWFGVLVPQPLRHGQQNFVDAVEACALMASLQNKLDSAYTQYRAKLREKHELVNKSKDGETVKQEINGQCS